MENLYSRESLEKQVSIEPLSKGRLNEAIALANEVFPEEEEKLFSAEGETAGFALPASLEPEKHRELLNKLGVKDLTYWVTLEAGKVIGLTGLYSEIGDDEHVVWLGWYCVSKEARNKGLGRKILEWTIAEARNRGYKTLRLWTSTYSGEADAQRLFEKLGFKITGEKDVPGDTDKMIFRQKAL